MRWDLVEGASFGITDMNDKDIRDDEIVFLECILGRIVWYWRHGRWVWVECGIVRNSAGSRTDCE